MSMTMAPLLHPLFGPALAAAALALLVLAWLRRLRWRPAWLLRSGLLALALMAAALPERRATVDTPPQRSVLIVDQSDSLAPEERGMARAQARLWLAGGENRLLILAGAAAHPVFDALFPVVDGSSTDLAGALALAGEFLGDDPGRIILATDGRASDPLAFNRLLEGLPTRPDGEPLYRLQTIRLRENVFPADVFVGPIYLPAAMWEDSPFTAVLPVNILASAEVVLELSVNEQPVLEQAMSLDAGQHLIPIRLRTTVSEIMTLGATVRVEGDPRPENNSSYAALRVYPAPRVLIVTENAAASGAFASALAAAGLDADLILPLDLPESLAELSVYQVILIDDILASSLTEARMRSLRDFVQQLGGGLIFTGGRNAFTLGGYRDTLLEPIMPVRLEPPPREQNSPLTLVLVLDRSASMDGARGTPNNLRPIALAREAALRVVETLGPEDVLGILTYNSNAAWSLPLQQVGAGDILSQAKAAMAAISPSGGTAIYGALDAAVTGLLENAASETRHIVLLSDGNDDTALEAYRALAEFALEQDITISTIALGPEADPDLMALLAEAGHGRYYPVLQAADLPGILIDESRAARDENIHEGAVQVVPGEANHPVLSGFAAAAFPALSGYNALESRAGEGAEDVLLSTGFNDPVLSVWQYGLGRVAAWTGDLGPEWAAEWAAWDGWGPFWSNVIRYTLPDPGQGPGQVEVEVGPLRMSLSVALRTGGGTPRNAVPVRFSMVDASGEVRTYPVPQAGPGEYRLDLPRPEDGVYRGVVQYEDEDGFPVEIAAPVVVNVLEEWKPALRPPFLAFGETIDWEGLLESGGTASTVALKPDQALQRLVIALLLLWPLEIAIRRRWLPWR